MRAKSRFVLFGVAMGDARMEGRSRKCRLQLDGRRSYNLLDLRFADDILVFGRSRVEVGNLLDTLVKHLDRVGLLLNTDKTVVITNEAQPPQTFATTAGLILRVLPRDAGQKWLGSMLTSRGSKLQDVDVQYHLQQASKVFHMNRWILQDRNVSIVKRLR